MGKVIQKTEKPTFVVNILCRQNATWQGSIKWIEGGIEKKFRSTLELIKLMDEAMAAESEPVQWGY